MVIFIRLIAATCIVLAIGASAIAAQSISTIAVTSTGWHTGIAIARADLSATTIPELSDFPDAAWVEFGWGNAEFYTTPDAGILLALKSTVPGAAVMHVSGLWGHPSRVFPEAEWAPVSIPTEGMANLMAFLAASFDRSGKHQAKDVAKGLYASSRFYPATGRFHLFNTCNTWTAQALVSAGLPIDADGVQRASQVMEQLGPLAPQPTPAKVHIERIGSPRTTLAPANAAD